MSTYRYAVTIRDGGNITDSAENVRTILTSTDRIAPRERVEVVALADDPTDALRIEAQRHADDLAAMVKRHDAANEAGEYDDAEDIADSLREQPLEIVRVVTYRVTLGTGGPAYGVDFHADGSGAAWHQDWFTERVYADLDDDTNATLRDVWQIDLRADEDDAKS